MFDKKYKLKAFTVLELLLTLSIMTVLISIVVFSLRPEDIFQTTDRLKIENDSNEIKTAYIKYKFDNNGQSPFGQNLINGVAYKICKVDVTDCDINNYEVSLNTLKEVRLLKEIPEIPGNEDLRYTGYVLSDINGTSLNVSTETDLVFTPENTPPGESFSFNGNTYNVIEGQAGSLWLDRNLGATNIPTNVSDVNGFGTLYQFGRNTDGHEIRTSSLSVGPSSSTTPGSNFLTIAGSPFNWYNGANPDNLWQGSSGINNPCPPTWRIPSQGEWEEEIASWSSQNAAGGFGSPLKLVSAGRRDNAGSVQEAGSVGYYWSHNTNTGLDTAKVTKITNTTAEGNTDDQRVEGMSVRCIKDENATLTLENSANYALNTNSSGYCNGTVNINGIYKKGNALTPSETVELSVFVSSPGPYSITTDLINGYSFSNSGTFNSTGNTTIILNNNSGTPLNDGSDIFTATALDSTCNFEIPNVLFDLNFVWAKRFGNINTDFAFSLDTDSNNRFLVSGSVEGAADLNGDMDSIDGIAETSNYGSRDAFISMFDSNRNWQWSKRFGGTFSDFGNSLKFDNNNQIIFGWKGGPAVDVNGDGDNIDGGAESSAGYGGYDVFLSKFDTNGIFQWAKRFGGVTSDEVFEVDTDSNNNIFIAGYVDGNADLNADGDSADIGETGYGGFDGYISVFNSSGIWQWAKRLGGGSTDQVNSIKIDNNNRVIATGTTWAGNSTNADLNGDGDSSDGGAENSYGQYSWLDAFITVFDNNGTWLWAKRYGGAAVGVDNDSGESVDIDSNNRIILLGYVTGASDLNGDGDSIDGVIESGAGYGEQDIFLSVLDSNGNWQWSKRFGSSGNDWTRSVEVIENDRIVISGKIVGGAADLNGDGDMVDGIAETGVGYGGEDGFISIFESDGTWLTSKRFGGISSDNVWKVTHDNNNRLFVVGGVYGDADINGDGDRIDGGAENSTGYGLYDAWMTIFE